MKGMIEKLVHRGSLVSHSLLDSFTDLPLDGTLHTLPSLGLNGIKLKLASPDVTPRAKLSSNFFTFSSSLISFSKRTLFHWREERERSREKKKDKEGKENKRNRGRGRKNIRLKK